VSISTLFWDPSRSLLLVCKPQIRAHWVCFDCSRPLDLLSPYVSFFVHTSGTSFFPIPSTPLLHLVVPKTFGRSGRSSLFPWPKGGFLPQHFLFTPAYSFPSRRAGPRLRANNLTLYGCHPPPPGSFRSNFPPPDHSSPSPPNLLIDFLLTLSPIKSWRLLLSDTSLFFQRQFPHDSGLLPRQPCSLGPPLQINFFFPPYHMDIIAVLPPPLFAIPSGLPPVIV